MLVALSYFNSSQQEEKEETSSSNTLFEAVKRSGALEAVATDWMEVTSALPRPECEGMVRHMHLVETSLAQIKNTPFDPFPIFLFRFILLYAHNQHLYTHRTVTWINQLIPLSTK